MEKLLMAWFSQNGRDLPWRRTRDPYAILVSEVMSQQYGIENMDLRAMQAFSGQFGLTRLFAPARKTRNLGARGQRLFA
jgi:A/G-specific adenine glycosylase